VRGAIVEDVLCRDRPDARKLVELLQRGRVQVDAPAQPGAGRSAGEVDELKGGLRPRAAGPGDRIVDAAPIREAIEPRLEDLADDVDDELSHRRGLCAQVHGRRGRLGALAPERHSARERHEGEEREHIRERTMP
jgi:hypothetical protein